MTFKARLWQGAAAFAVGALLVGNAMAQVNHNPTTEPRTGPNHLIVFTFDKPVTGGTATVTEGTATVGTIVFSGNEMQVPLTGVTDIQYVTLNVSGVVAADGGTGGTGSARIGFLKGLTTQSASRQVTPLDLLAISPQILKPVTVSNYLKDVGADGTITPLDLLAVAPNILKALPPP